MSATGAEQLRRLLEIVPRLADGKAHSLEQIATLVRAKPETVFRDLTTLAERYDVPGGFVEAVGVYFEGGSERRVQLRTDHFLRPMRLTGAELRALELGLAVLAGERPPDEQRAIEGARARLRAVVGKLPADDGMLEGNVDALEVPAQLAALDDVQRAHLATLRAARRTRRKVRLGYRRSGAATGGERTVCPYALVVAHGLWYLVAWCDASDGLRIFRLDRVESANGTTESFEVPDGFVVDAVVKTGGPFVTDGTPRTLVVRYGPAVARWIAEREGRDPDPDGSLTVEHPLADVDWAVRHVLQYGPDAEVLAPDDVRDALRARVDALLAVAAGEAGKGCDDRRA